MMDISISSVWPHPLPPSPIKGEVQAGAFEQIAASTQNGTSPLAGEDGRGGGLPSMSP
jgi:hypothetical protein